MSGIDKSIKTDSRLVVARTGSDHTGMEFLSEVMEMF